MRKYPYESCVYDAKRDIKEVIDGLSIDIDDALKTGVVKDGSADIEYNNLDNPDSIVGRIEDPISAIEARRALNKYGKKAEVTPDNTPSASVQPEAKP